MHSKFKTKIFEQFKIGYLRGNPNASIQEIDDAFNGFVMRVPIDAEERAESMKKKGGYYLSKEGRKEVREIWDQPEDSKESIPLIYLNEIERLEEIINKSDKIKGCSCYTPRDDLEADLCMCGKFKDEH